MKSFTEPTEPFHSDSTVALLATKDFKEYIASYLRLTAALKLSQSGEYKQDKWEVKRFKDVFKEGDIIVQLTVNHPERPECIIQGVGASNYFTTTDTFHSDDKHEGLQIKSPDKYARRQHTVTYKVDKLLLEEYGDVHIAVGKAEKNDKFGKGGAIQYYIDNDNLKVALAERPVLSIEYADPRTDVLGKLSHHSISRLEWDCALNKYHKSKIHYSHSYHDPKPIELGEGSRSKFTTTSTTSPLQRFGLNGIRSTLRSIRSPAAAIGAAAVATGYVAVTSLSSSDTDTTLSMTRKKGNGK